MDNNSKVLCVCARELDNLALYFKHIETECKYKPDDPLECKACGILTSSNENLQQHLQGKKHLRTVKRLLMTSGDMPLRAVKVMCLFCRCNPGSEDHHYLPQSRGGKTKDIVKICLQCHKSTHLLFSANELANIAKTVKPQEFYPLLLRKVDTVLKAKGNSQMKKTLKKIRSTKGTQSQLVSGNDIKSVRLIKEVAQLSSKVDNVADKLEEVLVNHTAEIPSDSFIGALNSSTKLKLLFPNEASSYQRLAAEKDMEIINVEKRLKCLKLLRNLYAQIAIIEKNFSKNTDLISVAVRISAQIAAIRSVEPAVSTYSVKQTNELKALTLKLNTKLNAVLNTIIK